MLRDDSAASNPSPDDAHAVVSQAERFSRLADPAGDQRTLDAARQREEELTDFLENAVEAMHRVGPDGRILWANRAELDLLGYSRDEYVGRHIADFHADRETIDEILARLRRHETLRDYEARLRCKDGSIRHVLISSSVFWRDGEFVHTRCFTRDITFRKRELEQRRRAERYLATQYTVTRVLTDAHTLREATPRILQAVCESAEWQLGALWVVNEADGVLRCVDVWQPPGARAAEFESMTRETSFRPGIGLPGRVWSSGRAAWIVDVAGDRNFPRSPYAASAGLHGGFGFPIRVRERVAGVIEFFSHEIRDPDEPFLQLFEAIGEQIGQFMERRDAEEARARLAAIVDSSDDAIISKTLDGTITSWNPGAERIFGYTAGEAVGQHISLVVPEERQAEEEAVLARLRRGERIEHFDTERRTKDGRMVSISLTVSPIRNAQGRIVGASKVARDVTGRRLSERALRDSEERYRRLVALLPVGMYTCEAPSGIITFYNERAAELWGRAPEPGASDERFCGSFKLWRPDGKPLPHDRTPMAAAIREGCQFRLEEVVLERPDGTRLTAMVNIDPIRDESGRVVGAINVFTDVTALRLAQDAIAESEERYRTLVSVITDVPWTTDAVGRFVAPQPAWAAFTGQTWAELQGFGWLNAVHPDDRESVTALWERSCRELTLYESQGRLWHAPLQQWRNFEARATPRFDRAGCVIEWVGACTDVTERITAEAKRQRLLALAEEHARIMEKLNGVGAAVASGLDRSAIVQTVTDAATELTSAEFGAFFYNVMDRPSGEAYLLYALSGAVKQSFSRFPNPRATAFFGPTFRGEGIVRLDDVTKDPRFGENPPYHGMPFGHVPGRSYLAVPVKARSGEVLGGLFFGHSKAAVFSEQHARAAEGVASWASIALENARLYADLEEVVQARDEFLSVAAHELRNPVNALQLQLVGLLRAARQRGRSLPQRWVCERTEQAADDVGRLARLVDNLLDVSRISAGRLDLEPEDVDLGAVLATVIKRLAPQSQKGQVRLQAREVVGRWDRLRLEQIAGNLLANAIKYGRRKPIAIAIDADADHAFLTVADQGIGMDAEQQKHLFERFQRGVSRRAYGGFGLGLWITRSVVEAMSGEITVESRPGEGSTFRVRLPRRPVARNRPTAAATSGITDQGSGETMAN